MLISACFFVLQTFRRLRYGVSALKSDWPPQKPGGLPGRGKNSSAFVKVQEDHNTIRNGYFFRGVYTGMQRPLGMKMCQRSWGGQEARIRVQMVDM